MVGGVDGLFIGKRSMLGDQMTPFMPNQPLCVFFRINSTFLVIGFVLSRFYAPKAWHDCTNYSPTYQKSAPPIAPSLFGILIPIAPVSIATSLALVRNQCETFIVWKSIYFGSKLKIPPTNMFGPLNLDLFRVLVCKLRACLGLYLKNITFKSKKRFFGKNFIF
jgi:hypothetical protein